MKRAIVYAGVILGSSLNFNSPALADPNRSDPAVKVYDFIKGTRALYDKFKDSPEITRKLSGRVFYPLERKIGGRYKIIGDQSSTGIEDSQEGVSALLKEDNCLHFYKQGSRKGSNVEIRFVDCSPSGGLGSAPKSEYVQIAVNNEIGAMPYHSILADKEIYDETVGWYFDMARVISQGLPSVSTATGKVRRDLDFVVEKTEEIAKGYKLDAYNFMLVHPLKDLKPGKPKIKRTHRDGRGKYILPFTGDEFSFSISGDMRANNGKCSVSRWYYGELLREESGDAFTTSYVIARYENRHGEFATASFSKLEMVKGQKGAAIKYPFSIGDKKNTFTITQYEANELERVVESNLLPILDQVQAACNKEIKEMAREGVEKTTEMLRGIIGNRKNLRQLIERDGSEIEG